MSARRIRHVKTVQEALVVSVISALRKTYAAILTSVVMASVTSMLCASTLWEAMIVAVKTVFMAMVTSALEVNVQTLTAPPTRSVFRQPDWTVNVNKAFNLMNRLVVVKLSTQRLHRLQLQQLRTQRL